MISGMSVAPASLYSSMSGLSITPGCRVHDPLLEQAVVQAADHAAVDLALPGQLVDDQARVLDRDDLLEPDHAGLDVDRDLGELAAADAVVDRPCCELAGLGDRHHAELAAGVLPGHHRLALDQDLAVLERRSSTSALRAGAIFLNSASRALVAASRHGGAIDGVVVEPPEVWPGGKVELPMFDLMSVDFRPRTSAAMIARIVRAPVPMSWVALLSSTEPSGLMVQRDLLVLRAAAAPLVQGHAQAVLIGPVAVLAAGLAFLAPADQLGPDLDLGLVDRRAEVARRPGS